MVDVGNNIPTIIVENEPTNGYNDETTIEEEEEEEDLKYKRLENELNVLKDKYLAVTEVLEPACREFGQISEEIEVERQCRIDAENVAKKVKNENRRIKRQSMAILDKLQKLDVPLDKFIEENEELEEKQGDEDENMHLRTELEEVENKNKSLQRKMDDLTIENTQCRKEMESMTSKNEKLQEMLEANRIKMNECEQLIQSYKDASNLALKEYDKINNEIVTEVALKEKAEDYARECLMAKKVMARQSTILMGNIGSDVKLKNALMEIEKLNMEFKEEKNELKKQIETLQEMSAETVDLTTVEALRQELQAAYLEKETLKKQVFELDEWKKNEEAKSIKNMESIDLLPPPPLPPPPPPPPPTPTQPLILKPRTKNLVSSNSASTSPTSETSQQDKLMQEMMNRIKKRPANYTVVIKKKDPRPLPPAMNQLVEFTNRVTKLKNNASKPVREKKTDLHSDNVKPPATIEKKPNVCRRKASAPNIKVKAISPQENLINNTHNTTNPSKFHSNMKENNALQGNKVDGKQINFYTKDSNSNSRMNCHDTNHDNTRMNYSIKNENTSTQVNTDKIVGDENNYKEINKKIEPNTSGRNQSDKIDANGCEMDKYACGIVNINNVESMGLNNKITKNTNINIKNEARDMFKTTKDKEENINNYNQSSNDLINVSILRIKNIRSHRKAPEPPAKNSNNTTDL